MTAREGKNKCFERVERGAAGIERATSAHTAFMSNRGCSGWAELPAAEEIFECPRCGNHVCERCARDNDFLCPHCFGALKGAN